MPVALVHIQRASKTVSTMDLLIAISAIADRAPLIAANRRHFAVAPDLELLSYR